MLGHTHLLTSELHHCDVRTTPLLTPTFPPCKSHIDHLCCFTRTQHRLSLKDEYELHSLIIYKINWRDVHIFLPSSNLLQQNWFKRRIIKPTALWRFSCPESGNTVKPHLFHPKCRLLTIRGQFNFSISSWCSHAVNTLPDLFHN